MKGQALITLLFFTIVAITITSAAVIVAVTQAKSGTTVGLSHQVYYLAESGAENALLRLLRDPNYTGEQVVFPEGTVSVTVTGINPKLITSEASSSGFLRKVQVQADYTNTVLTVLFWKEIE